ARPATSQMMVDNAGINHHATPEVRPVAIGLRQVPLGGEWVVGGDPMEGVGGVDALFSGFVEEGSDGGEFVGWVDAVAQGVGGGDGGAGCAGLLVAGVEVSSG